MSNALCDPEDDLATTLAQQFPPLRRYCPHLSRISLPQAVFLLEDRRESVYGGAARGGKSDALLMAALQYVDVPGYAALILRRTFPELTGADGLLARSQMWLGSSDARWNGDERTWTFPGGATLRFGHVKDEVDKFKYDGQAYQYVGFDELTSFTESQYDHIGFTRMSRSEEIPVPLRTRGSCTPTGVGYGWVKRRFISARKPDVLFVPARVRDNPGVVAAEYEAGMERVPEELRRRLLDGDWDVFEGAAFPWSEDIHVLEPFPVPDAWERFESFDHGTTNPSALLAWAVDHEGILVVFDEYYGPGLPSVHAKAIRAKREVWWPKDDEGYPLTSPTCWADPEMWATKGETKLGDPASDITDYHELGIEGFVKANPSRSAGRTRLAELLTPDAERPFPRWHPRFGEYGSPGMFVVGRNCPHLVEQLSSAPLLDLDSGKKDAGEIVDPGWESRSGHACAAARYGALSRPGASEEPVVEPEDPRVRMLARIAERERLEDEDQDFQLYGVMR